jgi:MAF protein
MTVAANAKNLALLKAKAVSRVFEDGIIIASDQICSIGENVFGKPGNFSKAFEQLKTASGNKVSFYTAVCVFDRASSEFHQFVDQTDVYFKKLKDNEIKSYLELEQPYQCAGSFKVESLGICLFDKIISEDPTALIGLPLIKLSQILTKIGINPLGDKIE